MSVRPVWLAKEPPLLICGCPGSGTSLVTKMLRQAGLFTGTDSGPVNARKYHESQVFKQCNMHFLEATIQFPHAPKSVSQFQTHNQHMLQRLEELAGLVDSEGLMDNYGLEERRPGQPWGWKDPRNSATALIWRQWFPELRLLIVQRPWRWRDRWKLGGSPSGRWYRRHSTAKLRELYTRPTGMEHVATRRLDVDRFTTDADYFESTLNWCMLDTAPAKRFNEFLSQVGFERSSLGIWPR